MKQNWGPKCFGVDFCGRSRTACKEDLTILVCVLWRISTSTFAWRAKTEIAGLSPQIFRARHSSCQLLVKVCAIYGAQFKVGGFRDSGIPFGETGMIATAFTVAAVFRREPAKQADVDCP